MTLPLAEYTVLDLTRARAGPTCVRQLADMGANVIQIESIQDPDQDYPRHGSDFQNIHRNKRSMTLNLKDERGLAILNELVGRADVLIENFRPDVKHRLGIAYETLSEEMKSRLGGLEASHVYDYAASATVKTKEASPAIAACVLTTSISS